VLSTFALVILIWFDLEAVNRFRFRFDFQSISNDSMNRLIDFRFSSCVHRYSACDAHAHVWPILKYPHIELRNALPKLFSTFFFAMGMLAWICRGLAWILGYVATLGSLLHPKKMLISRCHAWRTKSQIKTWIRHLTHQKCKNTNSTHDTQTVQKQHEFDTWRAKSTTHIRIRRLTHPGLRGVWGAQSPIIWLVHHRVRLRMATHSN
jgi:hypothetical protein